MLALSNLALKLAEGRSAWLLLVSLGAALGLAFYSYRSRPRAAPVESPVARRPLGRELTAMLALRCGVLVILVLFLFRPVVSFEMRAAPRPTLAVLVDRSRSMATFDHEGLPHRFARSANALSRSGGAALARLGEDFRTRLFVFDGASRELGGEDELLQEKPEGGETDLVAGVRGAVEACRASRDELAGAILFSDGIQTSRAEGAAQGAADPASELGALGVQVHTVCVGEPHGARGTFRDVRISAVKSPISAPVRNVARIRVLVEAQGFAGRNVVVQMLEKDADVARAELTLDDSPGDQEVVLTVVPAEVGQREYRIEIAPDPAENVRWNNTRTFFLNVTDPKVRVLYLEGAVRPEFRFLRRLLERDPQVEPVCLIKVRSGVFRRLGEAPEGAPSEFPRTREELDPFDVFIVGDLDSTHFTAGQLDEIARAVRDRGKGLLLLQGAASFGAGGYGSTPLAPLLPVRLGGREEKVSTGEFRMRLTPEGASHPIFAGCAEAFSATGDGALAPFQVMNVVGRLGSAGATVLAEREDLEVDGAPAPIVAVGRAGSGRVLVLTAGPTWPWAMAAGGQGGSLHSRFWGACVRFLAGEKEEKGGPGVTAWLDRGEAIYALGEAVTVRALVRGGSGEPEPAADVEARFGQEAPGAAAESARLSPSPGRPGEYEATFTPRAAGRHIVSLSARVPGAGTELGRASLRFEVEPPPREVERLDPDEKTLRAIAGATGGGFATLDGVGEIVSSLRARQSERRKAVVLELWEPRLFFALLVVMAGSEWYLRRRMQLA